MKTSRYLLVAVVCLVLAGCHTTKKAVTEQSTVSLTDTTKTESDSLTAKETLIDTTKTTASVEQSAVIEFVEGGGTVSIDTAGNVTLSGVKSIKGDLKANTKEEKGITIADEVTQTHDEQNNGIKADESKLNHSSRETETKKPVWYQTVLAKIGGLCCIAALLWLLFLYLKRKF